MGKSELRYFFEKEKKWLSKLMKMNFGGKEIIMEQLKNAKVIAEYNQGYISLKIHVENNVSKFPYKIRVPIEMRTHVKNEVPTVFLLHVINGYVYELEIFKADSSLINENIVVENEKIIIDERLKM